MHGISLPSLAEGGEATVLRLPRSRTARQGGEVQEGVEAGEGVGRRLDEEHSGDRILLICTYVAPPCPSPPYRYVNDPGMNPNAKVYTISFPFRDHHMGPLGG